MCMLLALMGYKQFSIICYSVPFCHIDDQLKRFVAYGFLYAVNLDDPNSSFALQREIAYGVISQH